MPAVYFKEFICSPETNVYLKWSLIYYLFINSPYHHQIIHVKAVEEISSNENKLELYLCMLSNHNKM